MSEKAPVIESKPPEGDAPAAPVPPRRSPGHRGQDVRDTVAEMAARAHEISLEAGSKMAAAMKDVINAAAGLTGFAIESARDLVQYMVRRGQMTQDEADKLIREAEEAHGKRYPDAIPAKQSYVSPNVSGSKSSPKLVVDKGAPAAVVATPAAAPPPAPAAPAKPVAVAAAAPAHTHAHAHAPAVVKAPPPKAPAAKAPAAKKVAAAPKKPIASKGSVKRPAVAKASAKPAAKKK
jgi:hypothetical protein